MKKKAFSKMLALILAVLMLITNGAVMSVSAEDAACPGKDEKHTLAICPDATLVKTVEGKTCGEWGYTVYQCPDCDDYFVDSFVEPVKNHDWKVTAAKVEPTCGKDGSEEVSTCSICNATKGGAAIKATGEHKYDNGVVDSTAANGCKITYTCTVCANKKVVEGGHKWADTPVIVKEPTYLADGEATYACTLCGATKTVVIVCEHFINEECELEDFEAKDVTCTEDGNVAYSMCKLCGRYFVNGEVVTADLVFKKATGHKFENYDELINQIPQYSFPGFYSLGNYAKYVITNKDENDAMFDMQYETKSVKDGSVRRIINYETITLKPNESITVWAYGPLQILSIYMTCPKLIVERLSNTLTVDEYPTCTTAGTAEVKCSECDETAEVEIPTVLHNFVHREHVDATCIKFGFDTKSCIDCGLSEIETIDPLGHDWEKDETIPATCTQDGATYSHCKRCGIGKTDVIEATGCKYKTVTVPATCKQYEYTFTYCENENCDNIGANLADEIDVIKEIDGVRVVFDVTVDGKAVNLWRDVEKDEEGYEYNFSFNAEDGFDEDNHSKELDNVLVDTVNPATCEEDGDKVYWCINCSVYFTEVLPKLGHDFPTGDDIVSEGVKKSSVSCTTDEVYTITCSRCDKTVDVVTKTKTGHKLVEKVIAPTCQNGYTEVTCDNDGCDYYQEKDITAPLAYKHEYTLEEAKKVHSLDFDRGPEVFREGSCTIVGLEKYACTACGKFILVVIDNTGKGHVPTHALESITEEVFDSEQRPEEFAAKAPTCVDKGWTAQFLCICGEFIETTIIEPLGHTYDEDDANCAGKVECDRCDAFLPALPHTFEIVDEREATCVLFGYVHHVCSECKTEEIVSYEKAFGHTAVVDAAIAPTCTEKGKTEGSHCSVCDAIITAQNDVPAKGHHNKAGELLENKCTSTPTDRVCDTCKETIGKDHNYKVEAEEASTCTTYGYKLEICEYCKDEVVTNFDYLAEHKYEIVAKDCIAATYHSTGLKVEKCSVCGKIKTTELAILEGVIYIAKIANAGIADADITDSSLVKVTVSIDAYEEPVWGYKFDLDYDTDVLTFVKAEFINEAFITMPIANDRLDDDKAPIGKLAVAAYTANTAEGKTQNHTVSEEQILVDLYFRVKLANGEDMTKDVESSVSFSDAETINNEEEMIKSASKGADFKVVKFLDVNADDDFNLADVLAVYKIVCGESEVEYVAAADIDKDGEITITDFTYIYEYLVGAKSYEELTVFGTVAA